MYSEQAIKKILEQVSSGQILPSTAFRKMRHLSYEALKFANLDHHRVIRMQLPEVIYAPGKTEKQLIKIIDGFAKRGMPVFVTRLERNVFFRIRKIFKDLHYHEIARIGYLEQRRRNAKTRGRQGCVSVVTGGTSDMPVAEEAAVMLELLGVRVQRHYDCGVAGLHRLLDQMNQIEKANVVICVAGMEGALASVLAGLIPIPVIAVPTSVGYGAHFDGLAPLLSMLNSCAQGVAVVNVDAGFSAACVAWSILKQIKNA